MKPMYLNGEMTVGHSTDAIEVQDFWYPYPYP